MSWTFNEDVDVVLLAAPSCLVDNFTLLLGYFSFHRIL